MKIFLENVRCFDKPLKLTLKPLTLLVGENSSGKSTFLAMLAYLSQSEFPGVRPNFNTPPFDLGTYDSIATYKGGRYGRSDHFSIGYTEESGFQRTFHATYTNHRGQPQLKSFSITGTPGELSLEVDNNLRGKLVGRAAKGRQLEIQVDLSKASVAGFLVSLFGSVQEGSEPPSVDVQHLIGLAFSLLNRDIPPSIALAPIRTKPRRTYDELHDDFTHKKGDHIPVFLARNWQEEQE